MHLYTHTHTIKKNVKKQNNPITREAYLMVELGQMPPGV